MLVLSVLPNGCIYVGEAIVKVLGIDRTGRVRLGVDAPRNVEVDRQSVRLDKQQNGRKRK
jgi:carbon storage regulator CsrA